jgi:peptide deformylase
MKVDIDRTNSILQAGTPEYDFEKPPIDPIELATQLVECMRVNKGIGLAAPQVGLPYRVFCMENELPIVCFNPKIVYTSQNFIEMEEGCLSYPGLMLKVSRPETIRVRFQTPYGKIITDKYSGLSARVFQHELDHLDGICFTDKVSRLKLDVAKRKQQKLERKFANGIIE